MSDSSIISKIYRSVPSSVRGGHNIASNGLFPQKSIANGDVPIKSQGGLKSNETWAAANAKAGHLCVNVLDGSLLLGTISDYFASFFGSDNPAVGAVGKILEAGSNHLLGVRDDEMYRRIYAMGAEANLTEEEKADPVKAVRSGKVPFADDYMENEMQSKMFGETVVADIFKAANTCAKLKPFLYPLRPFLSEGLSNSIFTIFEMPARLIWRVRFLGSSISHDFVTRSFNILKYGPLGLLGVNKDHKKKLDENIDLFHKTAVGYYESKTNGNSEVKNSSKLGLVCKMFLDRHKDHWKGLFNPEEAYKATKARIEKVYGKEAADKYKFNKRRVIMACATDLTGPLCAIGGIVGATVFAPLQSIFSLAGVESWKKTLNVMVNSGRFFSMINYSTRFIFSEYDEQVRREEENKIASVIKSGKATEATKIYYQSIKKAKSNAMWGVGVLVGSAFELLGYANDEYHDNKPMNLAFRMLKRFNSVGFLRFFSMRRQIQGVQKFIGSLAKERTGKEFAGINELQQVKDGIEEIQAVSGSRMKYMPNAGKVNPVLYGINSFIESSKKLLYGVNPVVQIKAHE